jgi:hypothetical protein
MKIGLDFHGVINKLPIFFSEMSKLFIENGHEIHIITGKEITEEYIKEINSYNMSYTHLFSIITHCKNVGYKICYDNSENPWIDINIWNRIKSAYCLLNNIDIMIDDSEDYGKYFNTPYMKINVKI